jgi:hypothetical protein
VRSPRVRPGLCLLLALGLSLPALPAAGRPEGLALVPLEPLGLPPERALRLEELLRAELERLVGHALPARELVQRDGALARCGGELGCLAAAGRRLGVRLIVAGNLGELGDSHVVNLKLIDAQRRLEVRRVSERLRGAPDGLIEAVRVAAHRLLAPGEVRGALLIVSDAPATVFLADQPLGRTPMASPVAGLPVGRHTLRLEAAGRPPHSTEVEIHFQKTTELAVRLAGPQPRDERPRRRGRPPWGWIAAGAGAVILGVALGRALASDGVIDCASRPGRCP